MRELRNAITRKVAHYCQLAGIVLRRLRRCVEHVQAVHGGEARRLREERGLTQAALAQALQLSPSYLNQLEHDQWPLAGPSCARSRACSRSTRSSSGRRRSAADCRSAEALSVRGVEPSPAATDLRALAAELPEIGRAVVALHARYRDAIERTEFLSSRVGERDRLASPCSCRWRTKRSATSSMPATTMSPSSRPKPSASGAKRSSYRATLAPRSNGDSPAAPRHRDCPR